MKVIKPSFILLISFPFILSCFPAPLRGDEPPVEPISLINAEKLGEDRIIVSWEGLETRDIYYNIYRSSSVLDKAQELTVERLVKSLPGNQTVFTDSPAQSGSYYYAVTTTDKNKNENRVLITEQNYIVTPVDIQVKALTAPATNQTVLPEVKAPETATNKETAPPPVIKEEPPPVITEEVKPPAPVIKTPPPPKTKKIKKETPADSEAALDNVLKKYYFKEQYGTCVRELNRFLNSRSAPEKVKAKARLFLGRTYIHLNDYDRAIRYLTQSREFYAEESDFWIKEALKNIK